MQADWGCSGPRLNTHTLTHLARPPHAPHQRRSSSSRSRYREPQPEPTARYRRRASRPASRAAQGRTYTHGDTNNQSINQRSSQSHTRARRSHMPAQPQRASRLAARVSRGSGAYVHTRGDDTKRAHSTADSTRASEHTARRRPPTDIVYTRRAQSVQKGMLVNTASQCTQPAVKTSVHHLE